MSATALSARAAGRYCGSHEITFGYAMEFPETASVDDL
jgi:hypothetical protein